jgi:hypothetical protein
MVPLNDFGGVIAGVQELNGVSDARGNELIEVNTQVSVLEKAVAVTPPQRKTSGDRLKDVLTSMTELFNTSAESFKANLQLEHTKIEGMEQATARIIQEFLPIEEEKRVEYIICQSLAQIWLRESLPRVEKQVHWTCSTEISCPLGMKPTSAELQFTVAHRAAILVADVLSDVVSVDDIVHVGRLKWLDGETCAKILPWIVQHLANRFRSGHQPDFQIPDSEIPQEDKDEAQGHGLALFLVALLQWADVLCERYQDLLSAIKDDTTILISEIQKRNPFVFRLPTALVDRTEE